jgi:hypothetical protein
MWCSSTACGIQETWLASATQPRSFAGASLFLRCVITPMCAPLTAARAAPISHAMLGATQGKLGMIFTIEFFRIRLTDDAHAMLDRLSVIVDDLDAAKVKARSLFETLEMPQKPDGLRILDEGGCELFFWNQWKDDA